MIFPHIAVLWILLPLSVGFIAYTSVFLDSHSPLAVASYALATYTLTVWCCKIPQIIIYAKQFKEENKYARRWTQDVHFRMNVTLYGSSAWNIAYAVFQLCLGFYHHTFWYYSLAAYYVSLAVMRYFLMRHTIRYKPGENMPMELKKYRNCGWVFLAMNLALTLIIFFMVYWNRTFRHHQITTIAMATYTFATFTMAIINIVKYRKYGSPVYSASKAISLAAACVSMLTLESTMLTVFDDGTMDLLTRRIFLGATGGAISAFIIGMAIYMIVRATKQLKRS